MNKLQSLPLDIMNADQLAEILGCEVETVHERTNAGDLPGIKFGRSWCYPLEAVKPWLCELAKTEALERKSNKKYERAKTQQMAMSQPVRKPGRQRTPI